MKSTSFNKFKGVRTVSQSKKVAPQVKIKIVEEGNVVEKGAGMKITLSILGIIFFVSSCGVITQDKQMGEKAQDQANITEFKVTEDLVDKPDEQLVPVTTDAVITEAPPEVAKANEEMKAVEEPKVAEEPKMVDEPLKVAESPKEEMRAPVEPRQEDFKPRSIATAEEPSTKPVVVMDNAPKTEFATYRLQKNETLMMAAFRIYGDYRKWKDLKAWNKAEIKKGLHRGMALKYYVPEQKFVWNPSGVPYLVRSKDTLGTISIDKYKTRKKWKDLYENNRPLIRDPNVIFAGFTIYYVPMRGLASQKK